MPKPTTITTHMESGLLDCFEASSKLIPVALRREFILVGGLASVVHGSRHLTLDVDIAASPSAHQAFIEAIFCAPNFSLDPIDLSIAFHSPKIGQIIIEVLGLGAEFVDEISQLLPLKSGFVASVPDLLRLRSATVADRGEDGDLLDFRWLLKMCFETGGVLPALGEK